MATQLKDSNNENIYPVVESTGGGGSGEGANIFDPSTAVTGKGVVYNQSGAIQNNNQYSCVFVPLEFDTYYRMSNYYWRENGGTLHANIVALGKGTASSFSNLQATDFVTGAKWLTDNVVNFTIGTNIYLQDAPYRLAFKTPKKSEMSNQSTTIGLVINTTYNGITPVNDILAVQAMPSWMYDGKIKGKNAAFFGDSITWAQNNGSKPGFVPLVGDGLELNKFKNGGQSGATTSGLASNMLHNSFRTTPAISETDYTKFHAVVIQIGTNGGVSGDINADIPDIGIYDISSYPYSYSASGKTITSATLTAPIDFFTLCFADTFYGNIALCIEWVRYCNPNCRIFLTTIPPSERGNHEAVRSALINLADKMSVQVIDAQAHAGLGLWNITQWTCDLSSPRTHFNAKGNEMWASYIANELNVQWYESDIH